MEERNNLGERNHVGFGVLLGLLVALKQHGRVVVGAASPVVGEGAGKQRHLAPAAPDGKPAIEACLSVALCEYGERGLRPDEKVQPFSTGIRCRYYEATAIVNQPVGEQRHVFNPAAIRDVRPYVGSYRRLYEADANALVFVPEAGTSFITIHGYSG